MHIYVCDHEKRLIEFLKSKGMDTKDIVVPYSSSCRFLNDDGCVLGDIKPFHCRLYPILFLSDGSLGIDPECTYSDEYLSQLQDPDSDAMLHFNAMKKEASLLGEKEKRTLADWSRYVNDPIALNNEKGEGSKH